MTFRKPRNVEQKIEERIKSFYDKASIYPPNKYYVGLWGPYVDETLSNLLFESLDDDITENHHDYFLRNYVINSENNAEIDFQWTVTGVTVPTVQAVTNTSVNIDATRNIQYPLTTGHGGSGFINLKIKEDNQMGLYQFFNALTNVFFNPEVLKPRSSFNKLSLYIIAINGDYAANGNVEEVPLQIFEFPSVVLKGMKNISFSQTLPANGLTYDVSFECPNLFQKSYQRFGQFKGIQDNVSDDNFFITDGSSIRDGSYREEQFELEISALVSKNNGYPQ